MNFYTKLEMALRNVWLLGTCFLKNNTKSIGSGQVPRLYDGQVMAWLKEIKWDLIYRRFKRCTGRTIQPYQTGLL
jgi:hypothetical protein